MYQQLQQNTTNLILEYLHDQNPKNKYQLYTSVYEKRIQKYNADGTKSLFSFGIENFIYDKDKFHKLLISIFKNYGSYIDFKLEIQHAPHRVYYDIIINDLFLPGLVSSVLDFLIDPLRYKVFEKYNKFNNFLNSLKQNIKFQFIFPNFQLIWWIMVQYQI